MSARRIVDYDIIDADSKEDLIQQVRQRMSTGWEPQGGIAITQQLCDVSRGTADNSSTLYDAGVIYGQAIVLRESK